MERIFRIATMALRVRQHLDDPVELEERARPAVLDEERSGPVVRGALVNEVNTQPADRRDEVMKPVQLRFRGPPVIAVRPIGRKASDRSELRALPPAVPVDLVRPSCAGEPFPEIREDFIRDLDAKRYGGHGHSTFS